MKHKTNREVIDALKDEVNWWQDFSGENSQSRLHHIACLKRAIAIVRASRKGRAKK